MPLKYTKGFKDNALTLLKKLQEQGKFKLNGKSITNVRKLCSHLGISSYSLYRWEKEATGIPVPLKKPKIDISKPKDVVQKVDKPFPKQKRINESDLSKGIFGIRFYSWYARILEIKDYGRLSLKQLKHRIGLKLLKESGLTSSYTKKAIKK